MRYTKKISFDAVYIGLAITSFVFVLPLFFLLATLYMGHIPTEVTTVFLNFWWVGLTLIVLLSICILFINLSDSMLAVLFGVASTMVWCTFFTSKGLLWFTTDILIIPALLATAGLYFALIECIESRDRKLKKSDQIIFRKKLIVGILLIIILLPLNHTFFTVTIEDSYTNKTDDVIELNFGIKNYRLTPITVSYRFHLDEPMSQGDVFAGNGTVTIGPFSSVIITHEAASLTEEYYEIDPHFLIMNIEITENGLMIARYSEQKSPYDWDYSTLPPTKK